MDSFVGDFSQPGEGKNLESAGVGQNRPIPRGEGVQASAMLNNVDPGADKEMIRIAENDLCTERFEFIWRNALDGSLGADRHEGGGLDDSMRGRKRPRARLRRGLRHATSKHEPRRYR